MSNDSDVPDFILSLLLVGLLRRFCRMNNVNVVRRRAHAHCGWLAASETKKFKAHHQPQVAQLLDKEHFACAVEGHRCLRAQQPALHQRNNITCAQLEPRLLVQFYNLKHS